VDTGLSGYLQVDRVELRASAAGKIYGVRTAELVTQLEANTQDIATNAVGSRVFVAFGTDNFVRGLSYDGTALVESNSLAPFPSRATCRGPATSPERRNRSLWEDRHRLGRIQLQALLFRRSRDPGVVGERSDPTIGSTVSGALRISSDGLRRSGTDTSLTWRHSL